MAAIIHIHTFEEHGLGKAPFRFVGYYEAKFRAAPGAAILPGASCDYCGTAIMGVYRIKSADGREFKVGCDCVLKTDDKGLIDVVRREANRVKADARHAREVARYRAAKAELEKPAVRERLANEPHPRSDAGRRDQRSVLGEQDHARLGRVDALQCGCEGADGSSALPRIVSSSRGPAPRPTWRKRDDKLWRFRNRESR